MKSYDILRTARLLVVAVAVLVTQALAMPQTNNFVAEASIDAIPLDLEVTPNGKVAVVRGNIPGTTGPSDQKVSFWRTDTGARLLPSQQNWVGRGNLPWVASSGKPLFSDAIAVTNSRIVVIGSADTDAVSGEDTTYVDILSVSYNAGVPSVSTLRRHVLGNPSVSNELAGNAHDVAITPDGSLAIVSHNNWIHTFEMVGGTLSTGIHIGASGACSPDGTRNSLELTNSQAVVLAQRYASAVKRIPWVHILDLSADPPVLRLQHDLSEPTLATDQSPHDLAITPNGLRAVVTATGRVGLYDLMSYSVVDDFDTGPTEDRHWNFTLVPEVTHPDLWDSVELTNTHAVVVANDPVTPTGGGTPRFYWHVRVFEIGGSSLVPHPALEGYIPDGSDDPAWDVALSDDGQVACVKSLQHDVALLDVTHPVLGPVFIAGPWAGGSYPQSSGSFGINDATVLLAPTGSDPGSQRRWAAFLGKDPNAANRQVRLHFYDLAATSWPVGGSSVELHTIPEPQQDVWPADLARLQNGSELVLRLSGPLADPGTPGGVDWSRWGGDPPRDVLSTFGAQGICLGADSIRVRRNATVSISWDHESTSGPAGFIHFVTIQ